MANITYILYLSMMNLSTLIVAKIITQDLKPQLKESIFLSLGALLLSILDSIFSTHSISTAINSFVAIGLLFLYFFKLKFYSIKKSFILTLFAMLASSIISLLMINAFSLIPPIRLVYIAMTPNLISFSLLIQLLPYLLATAIVTLLATLLFLKATRKLRARINDSKRAITVLAITSIAILVFIQSSALVLHYQYEFFEFVASWDAFFLFGFSGTVLVSFFFYIRSEREKMILQQQKAEHEILQYYTRNVDEYQTHMSKILHDVENILSSMDGYLERDDFVGAKEYFYKKIKPKTAVITENNNAFARLANVKIPEIRAIIVTKLREAQDAGIDITIEATDKIDVIYVDSVAIVRMLGIILDNAIEELTTLGSGKLVIAVYKQAGNVTFVVRNTCRSDIQKIHELKQSGFSTKGKGRGIGLSNLKEIADAHPDSISLQTMVKDGNFTQKLWIGGMKS